MEVKFKRADTEKCKPDNLLYLLLKAETFLFWSDFHKMNFVSRFPSEFDVATNNQYLLPYNFNVIWNSHFLYFIISKYFMSVLLY